MERLRKILSVLLTVSLMLTVSIAAFAVVGYTGFTDISANAWYAKAITYCRDNRLMRSGCNNNTGNAGNSSQMPDVLPKASSNAASPSSEESTSPTESPKDSSSTSQGLPQDTDSKQEDMDMKINIIVGNKTFTATLAGNSSAETFAKLLKEDSITINMSDYANMEKVGSIDTKLPRNDEHITTQAGDLILYQGNMLVIYYAPNSYSLTRLGRIDNVTAQELKDALGSGDVTVTWSIAG